MSHADRREAFRYHVPAHARLWWEGSAGVSALVSNVSATGCRLEGDVMPRIGEMMWVALTVPGIPDLRMPAKAVRESSAPDGTPRAAVRFKVPSDRVSGLELLLLQRLEEQDGQGVVLVIEADPQARDRILKTVRRTGARCVGISSADQASRILSWLRVETLLARAHTEGMQALLTVGSQSPHAHRVLMGACDEAEALRARGEVDLLVEDQPKSPGLHKVMGKSQLPAAQRQSK